MEWTGRTTVIDVEINKAFVMRDTDPEMLDHLSQYPDDYIVWNHFQLKRKAI